MLLLAKLNPETVFFLFWIFFCARTQAMSDISTYMYVRTTYYSYTQRHLFFVSMFGLLLSLDRVHRMDIGYQ